MKPVKTITLPYVKEDGTEAEYKFDISFISNRMIADYTTINNKVKLVTDNWNELLQIQEELATGKKVSSPDLVKKIDEIQAKIKGVGDEEFFKLRFNLVTSILRKNKYNEGEYLTQDFWEECVQPNDILTFISDVIFKDVEVKK